jgi:hypothetical protein
MGAVEAPAAVFHFKCKSLIYEQIFFLPQLPLLCTWSLDPMMAQMADRRGPRLIENENRNFSIGAGEMRSSVALLPPAGFE